MIQSPLRGCGAAPALERPREDARRCITERRRDLADLVGRVFEQLLRDFKTRFVQKLLEADAESVEAAIQRATVHAEKRGDILSLVLAGHERRSQEATDLGGEVIAVASLERTDLPFEEASHFAVYPGKRALQESRGEREGVGLRVEAKRNAEEPTIGAAIKRRAMREADFARPPIAAAELVHDVAQGGERRIADVVEGVHAGIVDMPSHRRRIPFHGQVDGGALHVDRPVANEGAQRTPHIGRVLHEQSDETEGVQTVVLADEQSEMRAIGARRAVLE